MKNILPCPRCGGEVEVVKLCKRKNETENMYRLTCLHCKMVTARGFKFANESDKDGKKRIDQYYKELENYYAVPTYNIAHKASGKDLMRSAGIL